MCKLLNLLLSFSDSYSFTTLLGIGTACTLAGFFFKWGALAKCRRKVLRLEDEMLANHSRILSLQKKNTELQSENKNLRAEAKEEIKLKAS